MKRLLILVSALIGFASAQNVKPLGFTINGHINGLAEKSAVFVTDANKPTDTLARTIREKRCIYFERACGGTQSL